MEEKQFGALFLLFIYIISVFFQGAMKVLCELRTDNLNFIAWQLHVDATFMITVVLKYILSADQAPVSVGAWKTF